MSRIKPRQVLVAEKLGDVVIGFGGTSSIGWMEWRGSEEKGTRDMILFRAWHHQWSLTTAVSSDASEEYRRQNKKFALMQLHEHVRRKLRGPRAA